MGIGSNILQIKVFLFCSALHILWCSVFVFVTFVKLIKLKPFAGNFHFQQFFCFSLFLRVVLVSISFDVVMCFYFFSCIYVLSSSFAFCLPLFISFCLMELRRTPYDLLERESELVSGYNIEYRGFGFTLLFLGEYS